ncbi:hypothetical protein TRICI_002075 [Trichomonascus ciferrii]|uniref:SH3 domain-containing protein n=1 Tax=Trichomonascus ciferrii TaxID=44093 RepID=A0A642VC10_9ASCO|nr:hypothetical protein TRICI_002075 [Trichomonascus ciferrii]
MEVSTDINVEDDLLDQLSSSPSIHEEEIDFQYVYALRTFVATEQGQANAEKGDAMILLNDANSYWWLVRMVKDSSVGFLPAEHVETPWERLARLNKHRNGEICSASGNTNSSRGFGKMFKSSKKSKAPPQSTNANRKSVSFNTQSVYVSASEYSDDDADYEDNAEDDEFTDDDNNEANDVNDRDDTNNDDRTIIKSRPNSMPDEAGSDDEGKNTSSELGYTNLAAPRPLVVHKVRQSNSKENLNSQANNNSNNKKSGLFSLRNKKNKIPGEDLGASLLNGGDVAESNNELEDRPQQQQPVPRSKGLMKAKSSVEHMNTNDGSRIPRPKIQTMPSDVSGNSNSTLSPVSSPNGSAQSQTSTSSSASSVGSSFNIFKRKKSREALNSEQQQQQQQQQTLPESTSDVSTPTETTPEPKQQPNPNNNVQPLNIGPASGGGESRYPAPPRLPVASARNVSAQSNASVNSIQSESGFQVQHPQPAMNFRPPPQQHHQQQQPQQQHFPPPRYNQQRHSPVKRQSVPVFNNRTEHMDAVASKRKSEIPTGADYYPLQQSLPQNARMMMARNNNNRHSVQQPPFYNNGVPSSYNGQRAMSPERSSMPPGGHPPSPQRYAGRNGGRVSPHKQQRHSVMVPPQTASVRESMVQQSPASAEICSTDAAEDTSTTRELDDKSSTNLEVDEEENKDEEHRLSMSSQPLLASGAASIAEEEVSDHGLKSGDDTTLTDDEIIITETKIVNEDKQKSAARSSVSPPYLDERGDEESPVSEQEDTPVLLAYMPGEQDQWNSSTSSLSLSRQSPSSRNYENGKNKELLDYETRASSPDKMIRQPLETKVVRNQQKPLETTILTDLHPDIVPIFKDTSDRLGQLSLVSLFSVFVNPQC